MLKIINEQGLFLELNRDEKITIEKNNPLFNEADKLFQDISYPGKAGLSENNKAFFKLAHLVETPNAYYRFPVQVFAGGDLFLTGNIKFRIAPDGFEFNLEPNLVALNSLLKNIKLTDLRTQDANYSIASYSDFNALMLDSCQNPDLHPYIFFPVYNQTFDPATNVMYGYHFVNYYNSVTNQFNSAGPSNNGLQSPYFKLSYVLQVVAQYLGFTLTGGFLTDDKFKNLCIYTRQIFGTLTIAPSVEFLPSILITDFFKQLRERHHLAFDFNLTTRELCVEGFRSIVNSEPVDITPYIGNVIEQELPDLKGYKVTLKSDQQDNAYKQVINGADTYPPLLQLVVGDGSTVTELECSTLRGIDLINRYPITDQLGYLGVRDAGGNFLDVTDGYIDVNNFPLRLIKYLGYNQTTPGHYFPEAGPDNFDADDTLYYQFLNDSKRLIITAYFPPSVLAGLKTTNKYTFKTAGYNYCNVLIEKIAYDIGTNTDLVPTKIYARTLNFDVQTPVSISLVGNAPDSAYVDNTGNISIRGYVKAYFDPLIHGFTELNFSVVRDSGDNVYSCKPILIPANIKGAGGQASPIYYRSGTYIGGFGINHQLRISQGQPKYLLIHGLRTDFVLDSSGTFYYANIGGLVNDSYAPDNFTVFF